MKLLIALTIITGVVLGGGWWLNGVVHTVDAKYFPLIAAAIGGIAGIGGTLLLLRSNNSNQANSIRQELYKKQMDILPKLKCLFAEVGSELTHYQSHPERGVGAYDKAHWAALIYLQEVDLFVPKDFKNVSINLLEVFLAVKTDITTAHMIRIAETAHERLIFQRILNESVSLSSRGNKRVDTLEAYEKFDNACRELIGTEPLTKSHMGLIRR